MLTEIIQRLRVLADVFDTRVAGAATVEAAVTQTLTEFPAAFVVPLEDKAEPNRADENLLQLLHQKIGVVVVLDASADPRGQAAVEAAWTAVRQALWYALLAWTPDGCSEPLAYRGARVLRLDAARLWVLFEFDAPRLLSETLSATDDLPPFTLFAPELALPTTVLPVLPGNIPLPPLTPPVPPFGPGHF
ncbi:hypothetical protein GCM10011497_33640 [Elstera cyanobacteriorum]|uniref:phage tail terminator protein n=1 Tax=Elstera cyanobacteriorum TaxID=2022747 RepID=UPI00113FC58A|nr:hypothetical protein [Elstera cyanobacteriorum]GGA00318.1 hypothetical protein GCM10011497_33640 [Elstera cyanobacteriorum]